jgi:hypothetical protein
MHCSNRYFRQLIILLFLAIPLWLSFITPVSAENEPDHSKLLAASLDSNQRRLEHEIVELQRKILELEIQELQTMQLPGIRRDALAMAKELRAVRVSKLNALDQLKRLRVAIRPDYLHFETYAELMIHEAQERANRKFLSDSYAQMCARGEFSGSDFGIAGWDKLPVSSQNNAIIEKLQTRHLSEIEAKQGRELPPEPEELTKPPQGCDVEVKKAMLSLKAALPTTVDLRARLSEVRNQGVLGACEIFTVIGGFEALANMPADLSEKFLYSTVLRKTQLIDEPLDDRGASPVVVFNLLGQQELCEEQECPWDDSTVLPSDFTIRGKTVHLKEFAHFTADDVQLGLEDTQQLSDDHAQSITSLLRPLLANGYLPLIGIHADRDFLEDWEQWGRPTYAVPHAIMVVGYGKERGPFSELAVPFFWVRDSSAPGIEIDQKPSYIHYKVAAKDLEKYIRGEEGIYVVLAAEIREPIKDHSR